MALRTVSTHALPDAGDDLRRAWDDLADATAAPYFRTWAWVSAWSEIFEPEAEVTVLTTAVGGQMDGILPLARLTRRLHSQVPLSLPYVGVAGSGLGAADRLGTVARTAEARHALWAHAGRLAARSTLLFENLDRDEATAASASLGLDVLDRVRAPAVDLTAGPVERLWKATQRRNIRNRDRRLDAAGVKRRWDLPSDEQRRRLAAFGALHRARWEAKGTRGGSFDERRLAFLRRLSSLAGGIEGPRLLLLELDGQAIAGLVGFSFAGTFHEYMTGWDPAWARFGPGSAVIAEAMRAAQAEGASTYDFLRGTEPHKYDFGAVDRADVTLIGSMRMRGRLLRAREAQARNRAGAGSGRGL